MVRRVLDEMLYLQPEGLPEKYSDWTTIDNNMAKEGTHTKGKPEQKDAFSDDSDNPY